MRSISGLLYALIVINLAFIVFYFFAISRIEQTTPQVIFLPGPTVQPTVNAECDCRALFEELEKPL